MEAAGRVLLMAAGAVDKATPAGPGEGGPQGHTQSESLQGCLQAVGGVPSTRFTSVAMPVSIAPIFPDDVDDDTSSCEIALGLGCRLMMILWPGLKSW